MSPPKENPTIITMAGPSGVGKTSLLAAMYSKIRDEVSSLNCSFTASAACLNELIEREDELRELATNPGRTIQLDIGPKPTSDKREFDFELHIKKSIPGIQMKFVDLPGGWYVSQGDHEEADTCLVQSQVVIVAVDAWALMERDGKYNNKINKPVQICQALERASNRLGDNEPRPLILFVLVKAEKYLHHDQHELLLQTVKACYAPLIQPLVKKKYPIAGCAIETVGGIELISVSENDGRPIGKFMRLDSKVGGGYKPKHCSIPLRLVFQIALRAAMPQAPTDKPFWDKFLEWFGYKTELSILIENNAELKKVAESLADKLRNEPLVWINSY